MSGPSAEAQAAFEERLAAITAGEQEDTETTTTEEAA